MSYWNVNLKSTMTSDEEKTVAGLFTNVKKASHLQETLFLNQIF